MRAINHIRFLGGGQSEPHLFTCDDERVWVLKLPGNPQASVLGHDLVGLRLAALLQVPAVHGEVVEVDAAALASMRIRPPWAVPGLALGTLYVENTMPFHAGAALQTSEVFGRLVVLDTWLETLDRRRPDGAWNLLVRSDRTQPQLLALDFGFSLQVGPGSAAASLLPTNYPNELIAAASHESLKSCVAELAALSDDDVRAVIESVPPEWLSPEQRSGMLDFLITRRGRIMSEEFERDLAGRR